MILGAMTLALGACGNKANDAATKAKSELTTLNKQVIGLYSTKNLEFPAKGLSGKKTDKAEKQYAKTYKLRGDLTKVQKKKLTANGKQIEAAKKILMVQTDLKKALDKDDVLVDADFDNSNLNTDFNTVKKVKPKYAASIADKVELIELEIKAIGLTKSATDGENKQEAVDQAKAAINAIKNEKFKATYLAKLHPVEVAIKQAADAVAEASKKNDAATTNSVNRQTGSTSESTGYTTASGQQTAGDRYNTNSGSTTNNAYSPSSGTGNSSETVIKQPTTGTNSSGGTTTPAKKPVTNITPIGVGGTFNTMAEAMASLKKAINDSDTDHIGHAYTVLYSDNSIKYSWTWDD